MAQNTLSRFPAKAITAAVAAAADWLDARAAIDRDDSSPEPVVAAVIALVDEPRDSTYAATLVRALPSLAPSFMRDERGLVAALVDLHQ